MENLTGDEIAAVEALEDWEKGLLLHALMGWAPDRTRLWMQEHGKVPS